MFHKLLLELTNRRRQLALLVAGSAMFACSKAGLVWAIDELTVIEPWLNYLIVTVTISVLGWLYHGSITFKGNLSRQSLIRYAQQAVGLKIVEYILFNTFVYLIDLPVLIAVIGTIGCVFLMRVFVYIKYVFINETPMDGGEPEKQGGLTP